MQLNEIDKVWGIVCWFVRSWNGIVDVHDIVIVSVMRYGWVIRFNDKAGGQKQ